LKYELRLKDSVVQRLEVEVNDLNKIIDDKKQEHQEQINRVISDNNESRNNWEVQRETHQQRI
jgi:hypothetical protein